MGWKQINGKRWIINTVRPKRNKNICLERFVTKVLVTTGRNWKQLKLVKQNAAYLYYIKLLNNKKIQQKNTNYWYKQYGWISKSEWKKSDTKEEYTVRFHLYKMQTNLQTNSRSVVHQEPREEWSRCKDKRNLFGSDRNILVVVMICGHIQLSKLIELYTSDVCNL